MVSAKRAADVPDNMKTPLSTLPKDSQRCHICLEPYDNESHRAMKTRCKHIFGESCLALWLSTDQQNSLKCPMCRRTLIGRTQAIASRYGTGLTDIKEIVDHWSKIYDSDLDFYIADMSDYYDDNDRVVDGEQRVLSTMRGWRGTPGALIARFARQLENQNIFSAQEIDRIMAVYIRAWMNDPRMLVEFSEAIADSIGPTIERDHGYSSQELMRYDNQHTFAGPLPQVFGT